MTTRRCENCKDDISHKRSDARFCSALCNKAPRFRGTYCLECGGELILHQANKNRTKYCSKECLHNHVYLQGDHDYFSTPNLENSYWAGFIAADGCILDGSGHSRKVLMINLKSTDKNHLLNLKGAIGAGAVNDYNHFDKRPSHNKTYYGAKYQLYSDKICNDLGSVFSVHPRKTSKEQPPDLGGDLAYAFIAGYIDGDGSYYNHGASPAISIAGSNELLEWIYKIYGVSDRIPHKRGNLHICGFYGNSALLVRDSFSHLNLPLLERKKNRWEELGLNTRVKKGDQIK